MSALLDFECRPAIGGYDVVAFDQARVERAEDGGSLVLPPDATDDEWDLANRWGGLLLGPPELSPGVLNILRPRSERTKRFDLLQSGPSAFIEFAQTPLTPDGVKAFADRYGPLKSQHTELQQISHFWGHVIEGWYGEIRDLRKAVALWDKTKTTGNFGQIIRLVEQGGESDFFESQLQSEVGIVVSVLLKKDPLGASPRLCIRPSHLRDALWVQLAHAIDGSQSLATCVECKAWFTIPAGRGRSDKQYCSDACRMRAYRKRKGEQ
jgi:hypothetical protein